MSQYLLDIKGIHSDIFKKIQKILLSYPQIKELKHSKQTSYSDEYAVIIMMRTRGEHLIVAFGKGYKLEVKYPILQGKGKVVRHLYFKENELVDESMLREMIDESIILGMEAYEMKLLSKRKTCLK